MFTGIIQDIGCLHSIHPSKKQLGLCIQTGLSPTFFKKGNSINVDGACLTVESFEKQSKTFCVTATRETLVRTNFSKLKSGDLVNLETPLRLSSLLHGHLVLGHVDFISTVMNLAPTLRLSIPYSFSRFFAEKGSVCISGVSLTVAKKKKDSIEVALIPETLKASNLSRLKKGDIVHVEIDLIARYLDSLIKKL